MIFISYRQEDTRAEVTNLHRRLAEHFGKDQVFVDYNDIHPGEKWPDVLRRKLIESRVLLAVIGPDWGSARFTAGKKKGRLRLDDPDDWVREEICTAIRREKDMRVIVVLIDNATLPETEWGCELNQLHTLQYSRIRNQGDFEHDFARLCGWLEAQVPELGRAAELRGGGAGGRTAAAPHADSPDQALRRYVVAEQRGHASIQLPLILQNGQPVIAPIDELRIDLPLIVTHEHAPTAPQAARPWIGYDVLSLHDELRATHTNALLVDRASRFEDIRREAEIGRELGPGRRLVITGDPGCGKSTLLQWIDHHYASQLTAGAAVAETEAEMGPLPAHPWLPVMLLCRNLAAQPLPTRFAELLGAHLKLRQFSDATVAALVPVIERLLEEGRAILLVDGLDEIPEWERRVEFCKLLTSIANRFPESPMVVTSRVVGFQAVREELASTFDHLLVGPLDWGPVPGEGCQTAPALDASSTRVLGAGEAGLAPTAFGARRTLSLLPLSRYRERGSASLRAGGEGCIRSASKSLVVLRKVPKGRS